VILVYLASWYINVLVVKKGKGYKVKGVVLDFLVNLSELSLLSKLVDKCLSGKEKEELRIKK